MPTAVPDVAQTQNNNRALSILTSLFFMMGFITCLNDILVPHLKEVFSLNYTQALLVQFCFFTAYAITSIPFGKFITRLGYKNGVIGGFLIAALGCALFYPAAASKSYGIFLGALFILASGVTLLQVSGNPYVTLLSAPGKEARTLTLVQAFNSLGTTVAPSVGALFILSTAILTPEQQAALDPVQLARYQSEQAASVQHPYLVLAVILAVLAVVVSFLKLPAAEKIAQENSTNQGDDKGSAWHYRHLKLGSLGIFCYVGAEVAIGSLLVSVMKLPEVAGLPDNTAAHYLTYYWGGAMVGRFLGGYLLNIIRPGLYLSFNALVNVLLILLAISQGGHTAMYALLAIGFFNSIMFPTIFSLATHGLGRHTSAASGILATAIVGGAAIPLIQGAVADGAGLLPSFGIAALCYAYIIYFGLFGYKAGSST
ncbi:MAG: sugar MFS transporter [Lautropia sp.]|nr:sugar MFS transporter [Lautropia sp.]